MWLPSLRYIGCPPGADVGCSPRSVPAITCYYGAFQDAKHIYIVMEYCARGDLLERLLLEPEVARDSGVTWS